MERFELPASFSRKRNLPYVFMRLVSQRAKLGLT